jgi:hypothetical protein
MLQKLPREGAGAFQVDARCEYIEMLYQLNSIIMYRVGAPLTKSYKKYKTQFSRSSSN